MAQPDLIPMPFAENATPGTIEPIQATTPTVPQDATWSTGFPQVTMQPLAAGGIPPRGQNFNGVLNALSQHIFHIQGGGQYKWDDAHGPYSIGDVLQSDDGLRAYVSIVNNNTDNFNTNPSAIGTSWLPWSGGAASELVAGLVKIATTAQSQALTADDVALTPAKLDAALMGGNARAATPAQFDNDTSLATTKFVKRAGLQMSEFYSYSLGTSIPVSAVGAPIQLAQATSQTYTVPLASSCPNGSVLYFANTGAGAALIARSGSDVFAVGSGTDTGITILTGEQLMLVSNGVDQWFVIGGSASLLFSAGFNHQKAAFGFQRLPSGLIIQWGNATTSTTSAQNVTFPISFPNGVLQVVVSCFEGGGNSLRMAVVNGYNGVSGFTFSGYAAAGGAALSPASGVNANYIAIGY